MIRSYNLDACFSVVKENKSLNSVDKEALYSNATNDLECLREFIYQLSNTTTHEEIFESQKLQRLDTFIDKSPNDVNIEFDIKKEERSPKRNLNF